MPRSRGTELPPPQRQSPRVPLKLKTTACTESNGVVTNHRSMVDRSPKVHDHRSPRSSSPLHDQKKRGTRVADLETKLGKAQEELKKLREQLASAESAKKDAQSALETAKRHVGRNDGVATGEETVTTEGENQGSEVCDAVEPKVEIVESVNSVVTSTTTDVFEVAVTDETLIVKRENIENMDRMNDEDEDAMKIIEQAVVIQESSSELAELRAKLTDREKEIEILSGERTEMKRKAEEAMEKANEMEETVRVAVAAKEALEGEMRRLRIQTEQWRKAAEAAAAVLATGDCEMGNGRCGAMEKGFGYQWDLPGGGEEEEGKRRSGSGMRMFGELWKKRGQQK